VSAAGRCPLLRRASSARSPCRVSSDEAQPHKTLHRRTARDGNQIVRLHDVWWSTAQNAEILRLYVDRFNSRDWDGLRELISADARLLVADRYAGRFADGGYLGVYSRMAVIWRLTLGEVDGEPSIVLLNQRAGSWEIDGIIRLDLGEDGLIQRVADYQHCPWVLTAGSIVVRDSGS
jgi:hypothetical protein